MLSLRPIDRFRPRFVFGRITTNAGFYWAVIIVEHNKEATEP